MKSKSFMLGLLAIALVFGMTVIGCGDGSSDGDSGLNGTWVGVDGISWELSGYECWNYPNCGGSSECFLCKEPESGSEEWEIEWIMNNGNFEFRTDNEPAQKGTYTVNGNELTLTFTHIYGSGYGHLGLSSKWYSKNDLKNTLDDEELKIMFASHTLTYSINGNTLTLYIEGQEYMVLTKK